LKLLFIYLYYRQEEFIDSYFGSKRNNIFHNVEVFIYVFDVKNQDEEYAKDLNYYQTCVNCIYKHSPSAKVFCFVHKMDLVAPDQREKVFYTTIIFKLV